LYPLSKIRRVISGDVLGKTYSTYGKVSNVLKIKVRRHVRKESPRRSGISRKVILKRILKKTIVGTKKWYHVA
jgi:hypothetical protein